MEYEVKTVSTGGVSLEYVVFGSGADTLVILPGLSVQSVMGSAEVIADAYKLLADDFTVYLFDRRKELPGSYTVSDMAEDTVAAIKALGLTKINIFGASQGGMIAMKIASSHPDLVNKLILGSTSSRIEDVQYKTIENWIELAKKGDANGLYFAFGEALYPKEIYEQSRELLTQMASTVTKEELDRFIILAGSMNGFDISSELGKIICPALILGDTDDRVLGPAASHTIADGIGDKAQIFMYEGYGHAVYDLAPDYRERMLQFLS
jgi:Predicted hydrolases or acyltransferases (alpha/beta hydrolase superfamily)